MLHRYIPDIHSSKLLKPIQIDFKTFNLHNSVANLMSSLKPFNIPFQCDMNLKILPPFHTGLISSDSIQITTLTAFITLKIEPFWLWEVILSLLYMINQYRKNNEKKISQVALSYRKTKTYSKNLIPPLLTRLFGSKGCQNIPVTIFW